MGVVAVISNKAVMLITHSNIISLFASIAVSVIVYAAAVVVLKILTPDEIMMLPAGKKIWNILNKTGFYK